MKSNIGVTDSDRLAEKVHKKMLDDYDPTPWCSYCGATKKVYCDCGEIADNE